MASKSRFSYAQRLFALLLLFTCILVGSFLVFQYDREKQFKVEMVNNRLQALNEQLMDALGRGEPLDLLVRQLQSRYPDVRVTLIDTTGTVLYDFPDAWKEDTIPNHRHRAEVMQAIEERSGYTIRRFSGNGTGDYFYSATCEGGLVVRTALPYNLSLIKLLGPDLTFLWIMLGITLVLCIAAYFVTWRIGQSVRRLQEFATVASRNERIERGKPFPADELGEISEHIVALYSQLQQTIADRNREHALVLHEEQEKIRLKRQLTNNINHELKTPVSAIQGYLETLMNNGGMDEKTRRLFIEKSYKQSERLCRLLHDIS
ncbi:MAG: sensor histidine kinase, partial [Porphyromonadaceae bacterium]|nr:sensor histidine kinase [Porphyromonadaceae bacterium]